MGLGLRGSQRIFSEPLDQKIPFSCSPQVKVTRPPANANLLEMPHLLLEKGMERGGEEEPTLSSK